MASCRAASPHTVCRLPSAILHFMPYFALCIRSLRTQPSGLIKVNPGKSGHRIKNPRRTARSYFEENYGFNTFNENNTF